MSKTKWVAVYNGDGEHTATVNASGEMKSLGPSNDKSKAVRDEIRAATLAMSWCQQTSEDARGWMAHFMDQQPMPDCLAGWLEREISTHDEQQDEALHTRPSPNWPDNLLDAISEHGRQAAAKHAGMHELVKIDPDWRAKVDAACDEVDGQRRHDVIERPALVSDLVADLIEAGGQPPYRGATPCASADPDATLDGIDQSEPATQPSEPLVEQPDIHSEPTQVGTIDERFEDGDGL